MKRKSCLASHCRINLIGKESQKCGSPQILDNQYYPIDFQTDMPPTNEMHYMEPTDISAKGTPKGEGTKGDS